MKTEHRFEAKQARARVSRELATVPAARRKQAKESRTLGLLCHPSENLDVELHVVRELEALAELADGLLVAVGAVAVRKPAGLLATWGERAIRVWADKVEEERVMRVPRVRPSAKTKWPSVCRTAANDAGASAPASMSASRRRRCAARTTDISMWSLVSICSLTFMVSCRRQFHQTTVNEGELTDRCEGREGRGVCKIPDVRCLLSLAAASAGSSSISIPAKHDESVIT